MVIPEQRVIIPPISEIILPPSEILISAAEIQKRVAELGQEMSRDLAGRNPLFLCTLKGAYAFFADLTRSLDQKVIGFFDLEFLRVSSYKEQTSTQQLTLMPVFDPEIIKGRNVVIIDDLVDTGFTQVALSKVVMGDWQAASVETAVLLFKKTDRNNSGYRPRYVGFDISDVWIFGGGPDDGEKTPSDISRTHPDIRFYLQFDGSDVVVAWYKIPDPVL